MLYGSIYQNNENRKLNKIYIKFKNVQIKYKLFIFIFVFSNTLGNTVEAIKNMPRPRFARSHLPWHLLPKDIETSQAKVK